MTYPTYPDLAGKVALITGSSKGIGAATARALGANGVAVVINGRDPDAVEAMAKEIQAEGGTAFGVAADATDYEAVDRMRARAEAELGPIDILAAFSGSGNARPGPVENLSVEDWHSTVDGNL